MFKKILAFFMTAVIATSMLCVPASAAKAQKAPLNEKTVFLPTKSPVYEYSITVPTSGTLYVEYMLRADTATYTLYDKNGKAVKIKDAEETSWTKITSGGKGKTSVSGRKSTEGCCLKASYAVEKGTYTANMTINSGQSLSYQNWIIPVFEVDEKPELGKKTTYHVGPKATYTVEVTSDGVLTVDYSTDSARAVLTVVNKNNEAQTVKKAEITDGFIAKPAEYGEGKKAFNLDTLKDKAGAKVSYEVKKGTYKVIFDRNYDEPTFASDCTLSTKITFKGNGKSTDGELSCYSITLKKGESVQLGGVIAKEGGTLEFSSSDTSVATVSNSGKVTAKGKGKATITMKYGTSALKIMIIVQ